MFAELRRLDCRRAPCAVACTIQDLGLVIPSRSLWIVNYVPGLSIVFMTRQRESHKTLVNRVCRQKCNRYAYRHQTVTRHAMA